MIHTRIATPRDAADFIRLNAIFNEITLTQAQAAKNLATCTERVILAEVDGRAVGFACVLMLQLVCYPEFGAEITELFVDEAHRRQGVGAALLQHAEQLCREVGANNITICTGFDNVMAQRLYHKLGYINDDIRLRKKLHDTASPLADPKAL